MIDSWGRNPDDMGNNCKMKRLVYFFVGFFLASSLFLAPIAKAQGTYTAKTCNLSDVSAAITSEQARAVDGDIITIPSGSCSWTSEVTASFTKSVTIQGAGAISATTGGASTAGSDLTVITNNGGTSSIMAFTTTPGKSFRVTGLALIGTSNAASGGILDIGGSSSTVRVDHCHIYTTAGAVGLRLDGSVLGVADHDYFQSPAGANPNNPLAIHNGADWNGSNEPAPAVGDHSWADTDHFGSSAFFFFEDDAFTQGDIGDAHDGARYVIRHSTYTGTHGQMYNHGLTDARGRSVRAAEIYLNTFTRSVQDGAPSYSINSGTLLYWGNTTTNYRYMVEADYTRKDNSTYNYGTTPSGWGNCGTNGPTNWDQNTNSSGYACLDQPGRGAGDLLSGNFPNVVNSTTGTRSWPHQALDPFYVWGNTYNDAGYSPEGILLVDDASLLTDNRDYYQQFGTYGESGGFNGTKGVGQGLLSARPSTCTVQVGYWATDTSTLYLCETSNAWTAYYTPYTYPHPLTQSSLGTTTPAAPTKLSATVN